MSRMTAAIPNASSLVAHSPAATDLASFRQDGFVVVRGLFKPDEMDALRAAAMAQVALGPVDGLYDVFHHFGEEDPLKRHPRMLMPHLKPDLPIGRLARQYLFDARLQPLLKAFLGEAPCAAQSMFYFKPPGARGQDMHQDDFYLRTSPGNCIAAWVAVDRVDDENGGLRVAVGSHRLSLLPTRQADLKTYFADDGVEVPAGLAIAAPVLEPGDVLFFGGLVIHGSGPNRSRDRFRRSFICHYVGASTTHLNPWNRPVETFDHQVLPVAESTPGPWLDSFAAGRQITAPH